MKKAHVLVTGGNGFLAGYLISLLKQKGNSVVVFDKLQPDESRKKLFTAFFQGDVRSKDDIDKLFTLHGPFETIYHLASAMPNKSVSDKVTWETNVVGTANLAAAAVKYGAKSFIFTSSNVTYGVPEELPVTEHTATRPIEIYGKSKEQAEKEIEKYKHAINIQMFRCPVISGEGRLGLQAILFEFISENKKVYVLGGGENRYQFVDAMDVAVALEMASHKKGCEVYTIGADEVLTLREIYTRVIDSAHSSSKIVSLPKDLSLGILMLLDKLNISPLGVYQYSMIGRSMYADTTKIKKNLGWKPKKTNAQSFIENYAWYIKNKKQFTRIGKGGLSDNRSLPKMGIFELLKFIS